MSRGPDPGAMAGLIALAGLVRDARRATAAQAAAESARLHQRLRALDATADPGSDPAALAAVAAHAVWQRQARASCNTALAKARLAESRAARQAGEAAARAAILARLGQPAGRRRTR